LPFSGAPSGVVGGLVAMRRCARKSESLGSISFKMAWISVLVFAGFHLAFVQAVAKYVDEGEKPTYNAGNLSIF